jgi:hypothetical protein
MHQLMLLLAKDIRIETLAYGTLRSLIVVESSLAYRYRYRYRYYRFGQTGIRLLGAECGISQNYVPKISIPSFATPRSTPKTKLSIYRSAAITATT